MCFRANIQTPKGKHKRKTEATTMKKTISEIESIIEDRIAELEEEYELDIFDRNDTHPVDKATGKQHAEGIYN